MNSTATFNLLDPRYTAFEVQAVTGLKQETLQTWLNRGVVRLTEQNPGRGRRRMFSAIDIAAKLAPMRRMDEFKIALSVSVEIAEAAAEMLERDGEIDWNLYLFLRAHDSNSPISVMSSLPLAKYDPTVGDPRDMRVSDYVEYFEGVVSRRKKTSLEDLWAMDEAQREEAEKRPIDPAQRELLARRGFHAEPVIVFPLGEIVNGALARLRGLDLPEVQP